MNLLLWISFRHRLPKKCCTDPDGYKQLLLTDTFMVFPHKFAFISGRLCLRRVFQF